MKIPANVSSLKSKLSGAFNKKPDEPASQPIQPHTRQDGSVIAKERAKRKALADELANAQTTAERKQQIIDEMQAELDATRAELDAHKTQISELQPRAKNWENYEHVERTKLLEQLPPERKKEVKDLPLNLLKTFVSGVTGRTEGAKKGTEGTDWKSIMESNDEAAIEKAVKADPKGFNEYMDKAL